MLVTLTRWYAVLEGNSEFVFGIRLDSSIYFELFSEYGYPQVISIFSQPYPQLTLRQLQSSLYINTFATYETLFLCFVCPQWIVFVLMFTTMPWIIWVALFTYCLFKFRLTRLHSCLTTIKLRLSFKVFLLKE